MTASLSRLLRALRVEIAKHFIISSTFYYSLLAPNLIARIRRSHFAGAVKVHKYKFIV